MLVHSYLSIAMLAPRALQSAVKRSLYTTLVRPASSSSGDKGAADPPLTGSAKLFQDAIEEDRASSGRPGSSRDHLVHSQGPIWTGDESTHDAVLRMLVDAHKPLRSGDGVKHNSADDKIKGWMKGVNMDSRLGPSPPIAEATSEQQIQAEPAAPVNPHKTTIPPHLHRPWHATFTGATMHTETPKVRYGNITSKKRKEDSLTSLLELKLPLDADPKVRSRLRALQKSGKVVKRFEKAREGVVDYKLGLNELKELESALEEEADEQFTGNRQARGSSALGAGKGGASGLRAWAGLVEDRIQRAKGKLDSIFDVLY